MNNIKIAPSILSADFAYLADEIKKVEAGGADMIHIDVMDGHFVPNISIGIPVVKSLKKYTNLPMDVHLMIKNPENYIDAFADAGADIITFHIEAVSDASKLVEKIHSRGLKAGVALNPSTLVNAVEPILGDVDMVLVMTVNPGFGGQQFMEVVLPKVEAVSRRGIDVEVDGGIGINNIDKVVKAGASIIVAGSSVFNRGDPVEAVKDLRRAASHNYSGRYKL